MSDSSAVWFIVINDKRHGPFSFNQLKRIPSLNPDTLLWREGFTKPLPARSIPELQGLFKDPQPKAPDKEDQPVLKPDLKPLPSSNELTMDWSLLPPPLLLWLLLLAATLTLIYLRFFNG